ncbi:MULTISPECIES: hypothetical protein [unclassified Novosphingobium]|uniref:hypothetical protein n=1 Tax=unclassified Novosphingobium TaxID=2644732 RepID=UPI0017BD1C5F|nr:MULTISPECIES: hypothetical protein [unclassified Novosphingobium]MBB3359085.1 hypothetical protein [Novosphingobium sp. BK256]MBB3375434.1 hypothetical protein [Novosphingobium sp. BK280]MBB3379857.1 hypothetical protein [Novosphingobium sp. BK258]MBB3421552.1 hypothetical protein [Novosphingobium sp. BK267]MBB3449867.1 hypothetical protein [Novosphingobium sp. BK352]
MRLAAHPLRLLAPALLLFPAVMLGATPAQAARARTAVPNAQPADDGPEQGDEKVNQLIIYGDDPCPVSTAEQITVCARKDEAERFRIPAPLRDNPNDPKNQTWTDRVKAYETVGAAGINSCSPVGSGGATGCTARLIHDAYAEKKQSSDVQFGKLIEEERQRRLSTIDKDAAEEQARVETLEKEYEARLARERDGTPAPSTPKPGETTPTQN